MNRRDFQKKYSGAYQWLIRNNKKLLEKVFPCMSRPNNFWNFNNCFKISKKFNKRSEWEKSSPSSYSSARKNGWLDKCCKHMKNKKKWTKKNCEIEAIKYKTRSNFLLNCPSAYSVSSKNKWLKDICKHMGGKIQHNKKRIVNLDTGLIYESQAYVYKNLKIKLYLKNKKFLKSGGYRWAYCDENGNIID